MVMMATCSGGQVAVAVMAVVAICSYQAIIATNNVKQMRPTFFLLHSEKVPKIQQEAILPVISASDSNQ